MSLMTSVPAILSLVFIWQGLMVGAIDWLRTYSRSYVMNTESYLSTEATPQANRQVCENAVPHLTNTAKTLSKEINEAN